ncbi:hypothetical protein [Deinococcus multiflagellatus]|uniref:Uncharacterized protein n=1 Tax=Deinococcus multiflagellatus TaxID=1656887 RepID=A0ABW1ZQ81_9DEIO|nr:hypothetical protein [Deinococcus multiflagellatus]MBZ9715611.1 hypothetical protein [Deinococcus multiflagellatus]
MPDDTIPTNGPPLTSTVALELVRLQLAAEGVPGWLSAEENAEHLHVVSLAPDLWRGVSPAVQFTVVPAEQVTAPDPLRHFLVATGQPVRLALDWPDEVTPEAGYVIKGHWLNPDRPIGLSPTYRSAIQQIHACRAPL